VGDLHGDIGLVRSRRGIAGIESGANLNTDRLGFSVEATDVDATGFKITIRRTQGVLYDITVTWLAYSTNRR
jgi:hypothetical protein